MSLIVDKFFYRALKSDDAIMTMTGGRIFNTARTTEDEKRDHIPYVIIMHRGMANNGESKDNWEGLTDTENVEILAVADNREALAALTTRIRAVVCGTLEDMDDDDMEEWAAPQDYAVSAGDVFYDTMKPCFYQSLRYECSTINNSIETWESSKAKTSD